MKNKLNGKTEPKTVICKMCSRRKKISQMAKRASLKWGIRPYCTKCWSTYIQRYKKSPKGRIATKITTKKHLAKRKEQQDANADK